MTLHPCIRPPQLPPLPPSPPSASPAKAGAQSRAAENHAQHAPTPTSRLRPRPSPGKQAGDAATDPTSEAMPGMAMAPAAPVPTGQGGHVGHTEHTGHDMAAMPSMTMGPPDGAYAEGSGTARNPGNDGAMRGSHFMAGDWDADAPRLCLGRLYRSGRAARRERSVRYLDGRCSPPRAITAGRGCSCAR